MAIVVAVALCADRDGEPVFLPAPGNEITKSHDNHLLFWLDWAEPAGRRLRGVRGGSGAGRPAGMDQAGSLTFSFTSPICLVPGSLPPISMRRGFIASGTTRSEERRVGKECTSWCRSRWSPYH